MKAMQYGYPKFRIKIPRSLVVVTNMHRKLQFHFKDRATVTANGRINRRIKAKHGDPSRKSLGSIFFSVPGSKRSSKSNELGDKPVVTALSQLLALETLEHDRAREGAKRNRKDKLRVMMNLPLLRFLEKKKGWDKFMRAKSKRMFARLRQVRRKTCSCRLFKIPSKILVVGIKLKMIRPLLRKKVMKRFGKRGVGNGDEDEGIELWKKRILMGRRCKPLSSPITQAYHTDCLVLPEIAP